MVKTVKLTAIYVRVSTKKQKMRSQEVDLQRWIKAQGLDGQVRWYKDKFTGKSMDRPAWNNLQASINRGEIDKLVVWRLDRLGRTASGLCNLFEDLQAKKVRLISLKDAIDLGTPTGRLMANMLASIASFETEIRGERVKAGQTAARADTWKCMDCKVQFKVNGAPDQCPKCKATPDRLKLELKGKKWGGAPRGKRHKITDEQVRQVVRLKKEGEKMSAISRATGISRRHIYNILRDVESGITKINN